MYALASPQETKVGFLYGGFTFKTGLCVGMKVKNNTKWLLLNKENGNLMAIFSKVSMESLTLGRPKWKSLIDGSSMHNVSNRARCASFSSLLLKINYWFIPYFTSSRYGCTWDIWRAREAFELFMTQPRSTLAEYLQTSKGHHLVGNRALFPRLHGLI